MVDSAWHQGVERANTTRPISAAFTLIETYGARERQYVNVLETLCS